MGRVVILLLIILNSLSGAVITLGSSDSKVDTSQKEVVESFFEAMEKNSEPAMKKILSSKFRITSITEKHQTAASQFDIGNSDIYTRMKAYHAAFPNLTIRIEKLVGSGEDVVAVVSITGIQKGPLFGIAPTNRYITMHSIVFFTIEGGQIVDMQEMIGEYSLMKQLGYIPI
jgi:predicted ester cyclase